MQHCKYEGQSLLQATASKNDPRRRWCAIPWPNWQQMREDGETEGRGKGLLISCREHAPATALQLLFIGWPVIPPGLGRMSSCRLGFKCAALQKTVCPYSVAPPFYKICAYAFFLSSSQFLLVSTWSYNYTSTNPAVVQCWASTTDHKLGNGHDVFCLNIQGREEVKDSVCCWPQISPPLTLHTEVWNIRDGCGRQDFHTDTTLPYGPAALRERRRCKHSRYRHLCLTESDA